MSASVPQAENPETFIREVCRIYEATFGLKRGRGVFADRAGITDRRVKALLFENARPYADEFLAAQAAEMVLRRERAAAIRAELEMLEGETAHGGVVDVRVGGFGLGGGAGGVSALGGVAVAGGKSR